MLVDFKNGLGFKDKYSNADQHLTICNVKQVVYIYCIFK